MRRRGAELSVLASPAFRNREANPYNALLYAAIRDLGVAVEDLSARRALAAPPSILHLHWPELQVVRPTRAATRVRAALLLLLIDHLRSRGTRVVWTIHNLQGHDRRHAAIEDRFWTDLVGRLDAIISLSQGALDQAIVRYPRLGTLPTAVIPHGHYRDAYPRPTARADARRTLGLPATAAALLHFGQVRRYKGVPELLSCFAEVQEENATLSIVGRVDDPELAREMEIAASRDPRVRLTPGPVASARVALEFSAADLVVLPYRQVLNSGSALLALSMDRPVLVPRVGSMVELERTVGESWVRTYAPPLTAGLLEEAMHWAAANRPPRCDLSALDWPLLAERTVALYREVADG